MSIEEFFSSARALKRELTGQGLEQSEVDAFKAIIAHWKPAAPSLNPTALSDAGAFYSRVRASFGALSQTQVDGFQALLQAFGVARWPVAYAAYGLATSWHETNRTMEPVKEAYWLSEDWRKQNLRYYPWYGRGFCQCTWKANYEKADEELGLEGALLKNPDLAMVPVHAAKILVKGMEEGWFTKKKLGHYLPLSGQAGFDAFKEARRIINGTDKAEKIAKEAQIFQEALVAGGWR